MITLFYATVVYNFLNLDFLKRPINYFVTVLLRDMVVLCKLRVFHLRLRQKKLQLREKNSGSGRKHVKIEI